MNGLVAEKIVNRVSSVGLAERLVHEHLAVEGEGHLAGGQEPVVDVAAGAGEERVDRAPIESGHGPER